MGWDDTGVMLTVCFADNILITKDGYENLTPTPKEVDELKNIIKSG